MYVVLMEKNGKVGFSDSMTFEEAKDMVETYLANGYTFVDMFETR